MDKVKALLKEQHIDLVDLSSEVQRKEITPQRIIRLLKIVRRNTELCELIIAILERHEAKLKKMEEVG